MKTYLQSYSTFFLFCLIFSFITSCNNNSADAEEVITQTTLAALEKEKIVIQGTTDYYTEEYKLSITTKDTLVNIVFDSLQFEFEFESDLPTIVKLAQLPHRAIPIFAMPGDTILIDFKLIDFLNERHTQTYAGNSAAENEVLAQLNKILIFDNPNYYYLSNVDEATFLSKINSLKQLGRSYYDELKNNSTPNPYFELCYRNFLEYKLAEFLIRYPVILERSFAKGKPELSASYYDRLTNLEKEDSTLIGVYSYLNHLRSRVSNSSEVPNSPASIFITIDSLFSNNQIINQLKYNIVSGEIRRLRLLKEMVSRNYIRQENTPTIKNSRPLPKFLTDNKLEEYVQLYRQSDPPVYYLNNIEIAYTAFLE